jgi:hypothetical protein
VWTTGPRSGLGVGKVWGVDSVVGGKDCVGFLRPGGTAGEVRRGDKTAGAGAGDGGEGTQAKEGRDKTLGEVETTGMVGEGGATVGVAS